MEVLADERAATDEEVDLEQLGARAAEGHSLTRTRVGDLVRHAGEDRAATIAFQAGLP
jgi:hypothetical protein